MSATTQWLKPGTVILLGALAVSAVAAWARSATSDQRAPPLTQPRVTAAPESMQQALERARGDLALAELRIERSDAIIGYSTRYRITADLAAAIYDVALAEGLDPALAFSLVQVESRFTPTAASPAGAIGYTQILLSTARLYETGLTTRQLYDRTTNLRLGFRYLRDLLERYDGRPEGQLRLALLAYNRGPAKVQELLDAGRDPQNGYATTVMSGYRRRTD
jgi:soluble lytic murein transglycosylase-like protein